MLIVNSNQSNRDQRHVIRRGQVINVTLHAAIRTVNVALTEHCVAMRPRRFLSYARVQPVMHAWMGFFSGIVNM